MGIVYKAWDLDLDRPVALKMMNPELAQDETFLQRFRAEAKALAQLEHSNIVTVFGFERTEAGLFIVMQYVEGETLAEKIRGRGPLAPGAALPIFKQVLTALAHAHQVGVIHRDIKPGNVMITPQGVVKVMDFGVAKSRHGIDLTQSRDLLGTLPYLPPEQVQGLAKADKLGDIYAAGMTFYEILTARLPFNKHESLYTLAKVIVEEEFPRPDFYNPATPQTLSAVVMKTIAKAPQERYQTAEEVLEACARLESSALFAAPQRARTRRAPQNRRLIASVALLLVLAVFFLLRMISTDRVASNFSSSSLSRSDSAGGVDMKSDTAIASGQNIEEARETPPPQPETGAPTQASPLAEVLNDRARTSEANARQSQTTQPFIAATGKLKIMLQPSGTLSLDGASPVALSGSPYEINLPAKIYKIKLESPGLGFWEETIALTADQTHTITIDFNQSVTFAVASGETWAHVFVDGKPYGQETPCTVTLRPGTHTLELRREGFEAVPLTRNFKENLSEPIEFVLKKTH